MAGLRRPVQWLMGLKARCVITLACPALRAPAAGCERVKALKLQYPGFFAQSDTTLPVLLSLFVDGFNPHDSGTYSVWAMTVYILNLPPEVGCIRTVTITWCLAHC